MYGINIVGGKTGVMSPIRQVHVLDIKPSGGGGVDAGVVGKGCAVPLGPGHPGLWLARGAALQGHALSHQHLSVLGLDHKTWPCWRRRRGVDVGMGLGESTVFIWVSGINDLREAMVMKKRVLRRQ